MIVATARLLEKYLGLDYEQSVIALGRIVVVLAALTFIMVATVIVAFDSFFLGAGNIAALQVGNFAPQDITAPRAVEYVSTVLTEQARQIARDSVEPEFGPPDPNIARQRTRLARSILDYVNNVRADTFATDAQLAQDLSLIRELQLDPAVVTRILEIDNDTWVDVSDEVIRVLERVMQDEITEGDLADIRQRTLPSQVGVRFDEADAAVVVAIVSDLLRANTVRDEAATTAAQQAAVEAVADVRIRYERGQVVVRAGDQITPEIYEALRELGLLQLSDFRLQEIGQAFLASVIVMVATGLYILHFRPSLIYTEPRFLSLLAGIFLIVLFGARLGLTGQFYIYPTAVLALLFVTVTGPEIAIIGTLGLAFLVGVMADGALEFAALAAIGGIIGALTLKRAERLNNFFFAGLMVAVINMGVATIFNLETSLTAPNSAVNLLLLLAYSLINGILTAAAAVAGMYIITVVFNLPTALKLVELSQPNQPLLQRLLREAPGSYTHSLQVANLAEQAAHKIGANAELVQVAALYHDIGKMLNPAFFTENQQESRNPHDALNDPHRSADIIISHVTEGDAMARAHRLPHRIRDFIREHHGTSLVYVFYKQAVILAGDDESQVDKADFTYPGPRPQSRETAVLMLADSCEAAVRSRQPKSKQEIAETVNKVIEGKRDTDQLNESGLTLNDVKTIADVFVEMLQAVYHPRINYDEAISRVRPSAGISLPDKESPAPSQRSTTGDESGRADSTRSMSVETAAVIDNDDDDTPLTEVPRLRRSSDSNEVPAQLPSNPPNGTTDQRPATQGAEQTPDSADGPDDAAPLSRREEAPDGEPGEQDETRDS